DCATLDPGRDPISDLDAIEDELRRYVGTFGSLLDRPRVVALNKMDVPEAADLAALVRPELEARGLRVFEVSAVSHAGLRELGFALAAEVEADRAERPAPEPARIVLRPEAVDDPGFTAAPDPAVAARLGRAPGDVRPLPRRRAAGGETGPAAEARVSRQAIAEAQRTVVKVGSSSLTSRGRLDAGRLDALVDALAARQTTGRQV